MFVVSDWRSLMGLRVRFAGQLRGYSDPAYRRSEMSRLSRQNPQSNGGYAAAFIGIRICAVKDPKEAVIEA